MPQAGGVCVIEWHVTPFRADRWLELWEPAAARMPAFGASGWSLMRSVDDPLTFHQAASWRSPEDFERYWFSDEITAARGRIIDLYDKPLKSSWYTLIAAE
jgi:hypothetical protein